MNEYEEDNERKIHDLIKQSPGLHLSKIAELLNINVTAVQQYLLDMEKKRIITVTEEAGYRRYYINDRISKTRDQRISKTRREIYNLVAQNPGIYLTKIAEMLVMSTQLTDYHLLYMERKKEIIAVKDPGEYYRRYYTAESKVEKQDKQALELLRHKTLIKIVLLLLKHSILKHKEICENLDMTSSRLSYHLNKLINGGIIEVSSHGQDKGYRIKNKEEIIEILKKYEIHLGIHLTIEGFRDMWKDLNLF